MNETSDGSEAMRTWRLKEEPRGHIRSTIEALVAGEWEEALVAADGSTAALLVAILNSLEAELVTLRTKAALAGELAAALMIETRDYGKWKDCFACGESADTEVYADGIPFPHTKDCPVSRYEKESSNG